MNILGYLRSINAYIDVFNMLRISIAHKQNFSNIIYCVDFFSLFFLLWCMGFVQYNALCWLFPIIFSSLSYGISPTSPYVYIYTIQHSNRENNKKPKLDFIKIYNLYAVRRNGYRRKQWLTEWRQQFALTKSISLNNKIHEPVTKMKWLYD